MESYFENNVLKSECKEVKIVMEKYEEDYRSWHEEFRLATLKKKLDQAVDR